LQKPYDVMKIRQMQDKAVWGQGAGTSPRARSRLWVLLLVLGLIPATVLAETATAAPAGDYLYVDDVIYINLRSGPETQSPTLKVIKSGTRMKLLERDEERGVSRVELDTGEEGWVLNRFVKGVPIARDLLDAAHSKITQLEDTARELQAAANRARQERDRSIEELAGLQKENKRLERELNEIRAISSNAVKTLEQNRALRQERERQNKRLQEVEDKYDALSAKVYTIGIGAALISLAVGIYIGYTPTRRQNRWRRVG